MIRATFIMEQHIGHRSFYENLRRSMEQEETVRDHWAPVDYLSGDSIWSRVPGLGHLAGTVAGRLQVRRGLSARPYDVAFFNTQVPAALALKRVMRRPYVLCTDITPRQYDQMAEAYGHEPDRPGSWLTRYKQRVNERLFQNAARIVPWSSWVAGSLVADYGVDPTRIEVIPPGVDTEVWRPDSGKKRERLRILFVGGDFYRKGGQTLLEAFRQLPAGVAELVLVTRTPIEAPDVHVHYGMKPNSSELIALYQSCDIFVLPTMAEAFGIVALEAGAVALPTIATAVGGLTDIVADGESGFLIRPGNVEQLSHALQRFIDEPELRRQMGAANRARIVEHFDTRTNGRRIAHMLQEVVLDSQKARHGAERAIR